MNSTGLHLDYVGEAQESKVMSLRDGHVVYMRKKSIMFVEIVSRAQDQFKNTGYAHEIDEITGSSVNSTLAVRCHC